MNDPASLRSRLMENSQDLSISRTLGASTSQVKCLATFALISSIIAGGAYPPFTMLLPCENPTLKLSWRLQGMLLFMIVLELFLIAKGFSKFNFRDLLDFKLQGYLFLGSIGSFLWSVLVVWSAYYTIMSHALAFSNMVGVVLIVLKLFTCSKLHKLEIFATLFACIGIIMTASDENASKAQEVGQNILLGDVLALLAAVFGAIFFWCNSEAIKKITSIQTMIINVIYSQILVFIICPYIYDDFEISFDSKVGTFGWLLPENFLYSFFVISIFTGAGCILCYSIALQHYTPIVLGNAILLEPVTGQFFGIILGQDKVPGPMTFLGLIVIVYGLFLLGKVPNDSATESKKSSSSSKPSNKEDSYFDGFERV